jgi:hypothetical protein
MFSVLLCGSNWKGKTLAQKKVGKSRERSRREKV